MNCWSPTVYCVCTPLSSNWPDAVRASYVSNATSPSFPNAGAPSPVVAVFSTPPSPLRSCTAVA